MSQPSDSTSPLPSAKLRPTIPFYYRFPLLYVEPLCALNGAYMLYSSPRSFLEAVSPHHETYFPSTPAAVANKSTIAAAAAALTSSAVATPPAPTLASVRVLTDMLAGMNLLFAFNLAITLRVASNDHTMWRVLCSGMLLSDVMHLYATTREFGWPALLDVSKWRVIDWLNFGIMGWMTVTRLGVVAGIGIGKDNSTTATAKKNSRGAKKGKAVTKKK